MRRRVRRRVSPMEGAGVAASGRLRPSPNGSRVDRSPARRSTGTATDAWWQSVRWAARTLTPSWSRRDGRLHTGGIRRTTWTSRLRQELRSGAFGAAGSWSPGIGARESAWTPAEHPFSRTGIELPAREPGDAASRGTSAARALASITCRAAGTTRARASVRPGESAGSAPRLKPGRRVGGGRGGDADRNSPAMQPAERVTRVRLPGRSNQERAWRGTTPRRASGPSCRIDRRCGDSAADLLRPRGRRRLLRPSAFPSVSPHP